MWLPSSLLHTKSTNEGFPRISEIDAAAGGFQSDSQENASIHPQNTTPSSNAITVISSKAIWECGRRWEHRGGGWQDAGFNPGSGASHPKLLTNEKQARGPIEVLKAMSIRTRDAPVRYSATGR